MGSLKPVLAACLLSATVLVACSGGGGSGNDPGARSYSYQLPADVGDGWTIGSLANVAVDQGLIEEGTRAILGNDFTGIDSLVIVRNGQLVHDVYFGDFSLTTRHDLRSATKSITSMLVGIAIDRGLIGDASEPALAYITSYSNVLNWDDRKNSIEIRHLLTMTSGLACDDWDRASPGNERLMYPGNDWVKFFVDLPLINDPGQVYGYCTAGVVALGQILLEGTSMLADDFAAARLFGPLGITNYAWEYTPSGQVDTGGHIHMLPRDMAKIGELMLRRGSWGGQSVISELWVDTSTRRHLDLDQSTEYGYLWWRQNFDGHSAFYASGNGGQYIFVIPDLDLVAVFTGSNYNSNLAGQPFDIMRDYVVPAIR